MDMTIDEFQRLADEKARQAIRIAFLKTFLEDVLPKEHYSEQLLLVNEVMTYQEEPKPVPPVQNNHYVNMTGNGASYTENNATGPQTPEN